MWERYPIIPGRKYSPSSLLGRGQKANTFELVVRITYHQYKYNLKFKNNLNIRIQNGGILADFYTNRRVLKTNENTRLTKAEYLDQYKKSKQVRVEKYQELMFQNKWTQSELARYLGVSRAWVSKVIRFS